VEILSITLYCGVACGLLVLPGRPVEPQDKWRRPSMVSNIGRDAEAIDMRVEPASERCWRLVERDVPKTLYVVKVCPKSALNLSEV
jgi:hypothetical protein